MSDDSELFQSAWRKWVWATGHSHELQAELKTALDNAALDPPFTTRQEYHPEFHGFSVRVATIRDVPPRWGLMIGDIVNGFHSCLDQLAWALVSRGKTPPDTLTNWQRKGVYFPICSSNNIFNGEVSRKLPGVRPGDIAKVRKAQPYVRGEKRVARHCFTTLQDLSNADKHRTIQPVWLTPQYTTHEVLEMRDCIVRRIRDMRAKTLELDTEIARVYAKKTGSDPDIALQGHVATSVSLSPDMWLINFLQITMNFVGQLLLKFAEPTFDFASVLEPGALSAVDATLQGAQNAPSESST